ncbi:hypothetical protein THRCLA_10310 [Thraustotheca clavata]|uniref:Uncharacterized protein n=1 Tax=Thraustotheca clavata TaxID=74557 RepID=A0A1V9YRQ4_9STRA|nr:hypothetical protein THRCLA_10310 [Thraustotheca clavata]
MLREISGVNFKKIEDDLCKPRTKRIHVEFVSPPSLLSHISFGNYYAATLQIDQIVGMEGRQEKVDTVLNQHQLMNHVHYEDDAQNCHILTIDQMENLDRGRVCGLVFYITQPSLLWEKWELRQLRFFETIETPSVISKPIQDKLNDVQLYRKYTINTSGTVSADTKLIKDQATKFIEILSDFHTKLHKN